MTSSRWSRSSVLSSSMSNSSMLAPAIAGANELENKYGRLLWRSRSMISLRPDVYPPEAPPSAFPSVPVMMSTRPCTPQCSGVPRPVFPTKPTAWLSSTITRALYLSARSHTPFKLQIMPSIENTPSVAISFTRAPASSASFNFASRSSISLFL